MYKDRIHGKDVLVIGEHEIDQLLITYGHNEARARKLIESISPNHFSEEAILEILNDAVKIIESDLEEYGSCEHDIGLCRCSDQVTLENLKQIITDANNAELQSHIFQEIKAKGFKEAIEGFKSVFTGKMSNVDAE